MPATGRAISAAASLASMVNLGHGGNCPHVLGALAWIAGRLGTCRIETLGIVLTTLSTSWPSTLSLRSSTLYESKHQFEVMAIMPVTRRATVSDGSWAHPQRECNGSRRRFSAVSRLPCRVPGETSRPHQGSSPRAGLRQQDHRPIENVTDFRLLSADVEATRIPDRIVWLGQIGLLARIRGTKVLTAGGRPRRAQRVTYANRGTSRLTVTNQSSRQRLVCIPRSSPALCACPALIRHCTPSWTRPLPLRSSGIANTVAGRLPHFTERPNHAKGVVSRGPIPDRPSRLPAEVMWSGSTVRSGIDRPC